MKAYIYNRSNELSIMHNKKDKNEPDWDDDIISAWRSYTSRSKNDEISIYKLSSGLRKHAIKAYQYYAVSSILQKAGQGENLTKNLDLLFEDMIFRKWFSFDFIFSQNNGKYRWVLVLYKFRLYKIIEYQHTRRKNHEQ